MEIICEEFPVPKRVGRRRAGKLHPVVHLTDSALRPSPDYVYCKATEQWYDVVHGHTTCGCGQPHTWTGPDVVTLCGMIDEGGLEFVPVTPWDTYERVCVRCMSAIDGAPRAKRFLT